jgi:hypothetical protein
MCLPAARSISLKKGCTDLHMHTTASDGTIDVGERVEVAVENVLEAPITTSSP